MVLPSRLPDDVEQLHALIRELFALYQRSEEDRARLQQRLDELLRRTYGRRAEQVDLQQLLGGTAPPSPTDPGKDGGAEAPAADAGEEPEGEEADESEDEEGEGKRKKKRGPGTGRRPLPKNLRRIRIDVPPIEQGPGWKCIGYEVSERLEWHPGEWVVLEVHKPKMVREGQPSEGVISPDSPFLLPKALPGNGLLARVLVSKFADHLPLHRQVGIMEREGIELATSTLCGWVRQSASALFVLVQAMARQLRQSRWVQADETPLTVLEGPKKRPHKGWVWVYLNDEHVVFEYTRSRGQANPTRFLADFSGTIQVDAYTGYNLVCADDDTVRAGCWAHVRRKFFDAARAEPLLAGEALAFIRRIYQREREAKQMLPEPLGGEDLVAWRNQHIRPIIEQLWDWLQEWKPKITPSSQLGKAIGYAVNQWSTLLVFLDNADISPDNNAAERQERRVALGRNNWLFAGSEAGAKYAAVIFSLIGSCQINAVDPYAYMTWLFERLPWWPRNRILELTPKGYADNLEADRIANP
jgi:transposase